MENSKLIIYDTPHPPSFATPDDSAFSALEKYARCKGCFDCWLKTPGRCIFRDRVYGLADSLSYVSEVVIVSSCLFGGFSTAVKGVIDRLIAYNLPFFKKLCGELHHKTRYPNSPALKVYFYGDLTQSEMECAKKYVASVALNFNAKSTEVVFLDAKSGEEVSI